MSDGEFRLNSGVAILPNGTLLKGKYDGYGKLDGRDLGDEPEVYHEHCWEAAGKPVNYMEASSPADDQGYFVEDDPDECIQCGAELDSSWDDGDLCSNCEPDDVCPNCFADYDSDGECDCED
jgi:hypothetical protein